MGMLNSLREIPRVALWLGLAGLLPFFAAAILLWIPQGTAAADTLYGPAIAYGAVILSFLGGIRRGIAVPHGESRQASADLALSVVPSLAGWAALFMPQVPALCLLIAGFLAQALWDVVAVQAARVPQWFGNLRMILTSGAVLSLVAMLVRAII
jgi:hypothetical protein